MQNRECLLAVEESAFGTPVGTPVVGTSSFYFNLPDSDCFAGVMSPQIQTVDYGGGIAVPMNVYSDHNVTQVNWKGLVYPSLQAFLINLHMARVTGGTAPWTTSEPTNDLASASFYSLWTPRGGAAVVKQFAGCKGASLSLDCSRSSPMLAFSSTLACQKEVGNPIDASSDPTITAPTDTQLPTGPYLFSHSATNLSFNSAAVTRYQSLSIKVTNTLDVLCCESHFPQVIAFLGRKITVTFQRLLSTTPNYRTYWQGLADYAFSVGFNNGAKSFTLGFGAHAHVSAYSQQRAKGKEFLETIEVTPKWDPSTNTDCTISFT